MEDFHFLEVQLTNKCNYNCKYCSVQAGNSETECFMPKENIIYLVRLIQDLNIDKLILTGGEPMMHPDFEQFLLYFSEMKNIKIEIHTNGSYMHLMQKICVRTENTVFQLSLDSCKEDINDGIRFNGSYQDFIKAINVLQNEGLENAAVVSVVITNKNVDMLEDIILFLIELRIRQVRLTLLEPLGRGSVVYSKYAINEILVIDLFKQIECLIKKYEKKINIVQSYEEGICPILTGQYSVYIDVEGRLYLCPSACNSKEQSIGILSEYNKDKFVKRAFLKKQEYLEVVENNDRCKSCFLLSFCRGGCPLLQNNNKKYIDLLCRIRKHAFYKQIKNNLT